MCPVMVITSVGAVTPATLAMVLVVDESQATPIRSSAVTS